MVSGRDLPAAGGAMAGHDPAVSTAANYRRFAGRETIGRAPAYAVLAEAVAADEQILAFLSALPVAKRQPNLNVIGPEDRRRPARRFSITVSATVLPAGSAASSGHVRRAYACTSSVNCQVIHTPCIAMGPKVE